MTEGAHHPAETSPVEQRVAALEALLAERGLVPEGFIEETIPSREREMIEAELEAVWRGQKTAPQALESYARRISP